ncbi:hypothetical protein RRG08_049442 [Elysia crispata]|uniref:Uncharacterized protein n=1 Tax=Elysia crispata TaxID=231223 RepID=A0AAE0ZT97_9GAST|nr:hypothetical protein RRG08_049442 [Elysia crispata]
MLAADEVSIFEKERGLDLCAGDCGAMPFVNQQFIHAARLWPISHRAQRVEAGAGTGQKTYTNVRGASSGQDRTIIITVIENKTRLPTPLLSRGERILPDIYMDSPGVVNSEAAISVMEMIASVIFSALSYMTELVEQDLPLKTFSTSATSIFKPSIPLGRTSSPADRVEANTVAARLCD